MLIDIKFITLLILKLLYMKKFISKFDFLSIIFLLALSSLLMLACENKKTEKVESTTESTMPAPATVKKKDSIPPLDTDNKSSTRPETSKNH